jgi:hypothetical protein
VHLTGRWRSRVSTSRGESRLTRGATSLSRIMGIPPSAISRVQGWSRRWPVHRQSSAPSTVWARPPGCTIPPGLSSTGARFTWRTPRTTRFGAACRPARRLCL